jgi:hypothetical protein
MVETKCYRTVRLNQFQPFDEATNFPKFLTSLSSDQGDFDKESWKTSYTSVTRGVFFKSKAFPSPIVRNGILNLQKFLNCLRT